MTCDRCERRIVNPAMRLGGAWLWRCTVCQYQQIGPEQQRRGRVVRSGGQVEYVWECSGTC